MTGGPLVQFLYQQTVIWAKSQGTKIQILQRVVRDEKKEKVVRLNHFEFELSTHEDFFFNLRVPASLFFD